MNMDMALRQMADVLKGKLALVTGGGSGIGRAVCLGLSRDGADVIVADINESAAEQTAEELIAQGTNSWFKVDVGESQSVNALMKAIEERHKKAPSIVVNCAGIIRDQFLTKMEEKDFDEVIRVNLKGTYLITQAVSKAMITDNVQDGSIVNIGSVSGKAGILGQANYSASKAGVQGLTRTAAKELAKYGIRCNAVLPGFTNTPMVTSVPEKVWEKIIANIPLGRLAEPEEIAETCVFLASPRSSYITGASIEVSGGVFMGS